MKGFLFNFLCKKINKKHFAKFISYKKQIFNTLFERFCPKICYSFAEFLETMKIKVCRKEHFNAAHRLHNPAWDEATNQKIFGKCNNQYFHGHNYELIVEVIGEINPETGYVMDMKELSDIIRNHVTERFDHKNLNLEIDEFRNLNPTAENIAVVIWNILRKQISPQHELKIKLYETERNFVEYPA